MIYSGNQIESQGFGLAAERTVAAALERQRPDWHIIHSRWSVHGGERNYVEGEADIIVVIPNRGFVVIEVKSHPFQRLVEGCWQYSIDGVRYENHGKMPWWQASEVMHRWRKEFVKANIGGHYGVPCGFAVCFPNCDRSFKFSAGSAHLPLGEGYLDFTIVRGDLDQVAELIEHALVKWARGGTCDTKRVLEMLAPSGVQFQPLRPDHRTYIADSLIKLTGEQTRAVEGFMANASKGAAIIGGAGTGKSLIARHIAALAGKRGKNVWLLCYNALLAEDHESELARFGVKCATFHGFVRKMVDRFGASIGITWPREADGQFLANGVEDLLMALIRHGKIEKLDLLVIDEYQDLSFEQAATLRSLQAAERLIFCDPRQNLFGPQGAGDLNIPGDFAKYQLQLNVRNVREVAACVQRVGNGDVSAAQLRQCPAMAVWPEITRPANSKSALAELRAKLHQWLGRDYQMSPRDIAVLCTDKVARDQVVTSIGNVGQVGPKRNLSDWKADRGFLVETIGRFKGLDAGAVVLLGASKPESSGAGFTTSDVYVGLSRARFELCIIPSDSAGEFWFKQLVEDAREAEELELEGL